MKRNLAQVSFDEMADIRKELLHDGVPIRELTKKYNVNHRVISAIRKDVDVYNNLPANTKPIKGSSSRYRIDRLGNVYSSYGYVAGDKWALLASHRSNSSGRPRVALYNEVGVKTSYDLALLVAKAFLADDGDWVGFKDHNQGNVDVDNLYWCEKPYRLSDKQRTDIRNSDASASELAEIYDVSLTTIYKIKKQ